MRATPLTIKQANQFVKDHHRHSIPTVGCKFAVGAEKDGLLVGVAIAGRPVARRLDDGKTLEVLRVATDGTRNANSFLYSTVVKIGRLMGYRTLITYTLESESGASLKAVGAKPVSTVTAQEWSRPSRGRKSQSVYSQDKIRWEF